jgi:hypothetical protein
MGGGSGEYQAVKTVILALALCFCLAASQATIYIAQATSGGDTGADCADAHSAAWFNTAGNWGSGSTQIGAGSTVHLCGTFTASAGASGYLSVQGSGSSGNPITVLFESGAILTAPYWGANGALLASSLSWIIIDGGTSGTVQATANGSALANQQDGSGVVLSSCDHCEVKNLTISNIYVHSSLSDNSGQNTIGINESGGSSSNLHNNTIHDVNACIQYTYPGSTTVSNLSIFQNTTYNCNHGITVGDGNTSAVISTVLIYQNSFHDAVSWDDTADNNHHDGIFAFAVHASSTLTGLQIYNNHVYGDWGIHCTANIYVSQTAGGSVNTYYVFNNLLGATNASTHACGNGFLSANSNGGFWLNNTAISDSNASLVGFNSLGTGHTIKNNAFYNIFTGIYSPVGTSITASDYNSFFGLNGSLAMHYQGTWYGSVPAWVTGTGFDTHSVTSNPNFGAGAIPQSGSPLIAAGTNLTSLSITALNSDASGISRPASLPWDIGAYQFIPGSVTSGPSTFSGPVVIHP